MGRIKKVLTEKTQAKTLAFRLFVFAFGLYILAVVSGGCSYYGQPGETAAEGRRRHDRVFRLNHQEMMQDIDKAFHLDRPSKLTDKRIP
jgi:hypothetical protein